MMSPASLRNRLVLGAVIVGITFAALFGAAATWRIRHAEDQAVRAALESRVELARDEVASDGTLRQDAGSPKTDLLQVIGPDGVVRSSSPALRDLGPLISVSAANRTPGGAQSRIALQSPDADLALLGVPVRLTAGGASPAGQGALVVAVDAEGFNAATSDLLGVLLVGLVAVVLAITLLSWVLTGRALRSVTRLTESAEDVRPQDLATGLPVPRHDAELGRLVGALNRMLVRLHDSHATELAFAADAGHRLRTPVATLRAEAELALRQDDPAEQAAALERIVEDADQLTLVVDRMLARTRARSHPPESLEESLANAEVRWQRQAELAAVTLELTMSPAISSGLSCGELVGIIDPVLDNALRHTAAHRTVRIDVYTDPDPDSGHAHGQVVVDICNPGIGVPDRIAPHVFDAWVSSRDASTAGGLGLWLARETARDLGGEVSLMAAGPPMTAFRILLPQTPT
ncbi:MAG: Two component signal transduction histidine-protein kinase/phosphatase [Marmoricola sp.]|nr:Two component signal transduction histidine-protein kinase/phosphatase [Marmoricola sp.]